MSFVGNLLNETEESNWFIRMEPKLICRSQQGVTWAVHSGNIWVTDWPYGYIYTDFSPYGSGGLVSSVGDLSTNGEYFYDHSQKKVYIYDSFNPNSVSIWVFAFELYFCTTEIYAPRIPNGAVSDSNPPVYWNPWIVKPPVVSQGSSDAMFGFIPAEASSIEIQCADGEILSILKNAVFNKAKCRIFQSLGDPNDSSNIQGVTLAFVSSYKLDGGAVSFSVESSFSILDENYELTRFSKSTFPNLDPRAEDEGWFIRKVYGHRRGFLPVNIDYNATPTTSSNRQWVVSGEQANKATYTWDIIGAGTDTDTTEIDLTDNGGNLISVGDFVRLTDVNQTVEVISFSGAGDSKIEHAAVGARGAGTVVRPFLSQVVIIDRNGLTHKLKYIDHWTESNFAGDTKGFTLVNNFEASIAGFPSPFDPSVDQLYVNVYGEVDVPFLSIEAQDLVSVGRYGGTLDHPVGIIYDILVANAEPRNGFSLDQAGFIEAVNEVGTTAKVGFSIPDGIADPEPTVRSIIERVCESWFLRLHDSVYINNAAVRVSEFDTVQATPPDFELDDSEISGVEFEFDSKDFYSSFQVNFNQTELFEAANSFQFSKRIASVSDGVKNAYGLFRKFIADTVLVDSADGQTIVNKFRTILGAQRFKVSFFAPYRLYSAKIGDVVQITREKIPGVAFQDGVTQTVKGSIISMQRSSGGVAITIEVF